MPSHDTNGTETAAFCYPDSIIYRGYAAPMRLEGDVYDLEIDGHIPAGLNGSYVRASADPQYPPLHGKDIFINGDGIMHMVRLDNGHADLKIRYVQTEKLRLERAARRALFGTYRNRFTDDPSVAGQDGGTANTSAWWHAGKLFALKEASRPMRLDPDTLETLGEWDFGGKLASVTFTAHPKTDPRTGEVVAFGYNTAGVASNMIEIYFISPDGELTRTESFEAPYSFMAHDFAISENYIVFTVYPMICDWERVKQGHDYFHWDSRLPTKFAVIPRKPGGTKEIRWFSSSVNGMETHAFNAWEDGNRLHYEHFFTATGWLSQFPDINDPAAKEQPPFAYRRTFDLSSDADVVESVRLFPHVGEMPMMDPRYVTRQTRHFYFGTANAALGPMLDWGPKGPPFTCIGHYDGETKQLAYWYAGPNASPEEPIFVPKQPGGPQGEGWLMTIVGRRAENRTDLVILDAQNIAAGPVATIKFPCRVHEGFHGTWIPGVERSVLASIDFAAARIIIDAALGLARERGFKPIVVAVLDSRGQLKAYAAEDGVSLGRFDIAHGKANGALAMGVGSRTLRKLAKDNAGFVTSLIHTVKGGLVPNPGGVLIRDGAGAILGAVGISGDLGENDETAAIAGIQAAGLVADPGVD